MRDQHVDDEIDLIDLWLIFQRHWKVFAVIVALGVALGVAYALLKPPVYGYRTLIEIGTQIVDGDTRLIESPVSLRAKVSEVYRTMVLRAFYDKYPEVDHPFDVDVSVPKDAEFLVIEDTAPADYAEYVEQIHEQLLKLVLQDHGRIVSVNRNAIQVQLENTRNELARLEEEEALLKVELERLQDQHENRLAILDEQIALARAELKRLDDLGELVQGQIAELRGLLADALANREQAIKEAGNASGAMTLMLINDELQRNQQMLSELRERHAVRIPNMRSNYEQKIESLQNEKAILSSELSNERYRFVQQISEVQRQQKEVKGQVSQLELRLENLRDTRAIAIAAESIRPVGIHPLVILVISTGGGVLFGMFAVLLQHLFVIARQRSAISR